MFGLNPRFGTADPKSSGRPRPSVVGPVEIAYLAGAALVALVAFRDAPARMLEAYREDRVLDDAVYHAANAGSVLVVSAWLVAVLTGLDRPLSATVAPVSRLAWPGLVLAAGGFALALWARTSLGAAFAPAAVVPADERVVDAGPYGHVRHPFYVGLTAALAGGVLALDSWATLASLVLLWPLVRAVAVLEEAHLADELGAVYEDYRARVPRWVPRLGG